jgi:hypothetical protein
MKYIQHTLILLTLTAIGACSSSTDKLRPDVVNAFADDGRAADSLKTAYQCETVTLDKWEETDLTDSTFSFCFINSRIVPTTEMVLKNDILKEIARSVKKSLKAPNRFNSIQIVFVTSRKMFWFGGETQSQSMGGVIPGIDL